MLAAASRATLKVPTRFTSITRVNRSRSSGTPSRAVTAASPMPAQLTQMRSSPSDSARAIAAETASSSRTSPATGFKSSPTSACSRPRSRSRTTTVAPCDRSASAVARPSPDAPPATSATAPSGFTSPSPARPQYARSVQMRYGYKASAEQFVPRDLIDYSVQAEQLGFDSVAVSDHFQPWRHHGGHSPAWLPWLGALGERTERVLLGTSVLTPTLRYHPSIVAQAFATLACLNPGRVFLGVGTGEALNETPATGAEWPGAKERRLRLAEAGELMRRPWTEEPVTLPGADFPTPNATIYHRADAPGPGFIGPPGPPAAERARR